MSTFMTEQETFAGFAEIIERFADFPASEVTLEASLTADLGIDSLSMVEIVVASQDKFGVEIPDEELRALRTVQDVVSFVQRSHERHGRRLSA
jgi:acyl carrier protein